jgi:hypothetical protein
LRIGRVPTLLARIRSGVGRDPPRFAGAASVERGTADAESSADFLLMSFTIAPRRARGPSRFLRNVGQQTAQVALLDRLCVCG